MSEYSSCFFVLFSLPRRCLLFTNCSLTLNDAQSSDYDNYVDTDDCDDNEELKIMTRYNYSHIAIKFNINLSPSPRSYR